MQRIAVQRETHSYFAGDGGVVQLWHEQDLLHDDHHCFAHSARLHKKLEDAG